MQLAVRQKHGFTMITQTCTTRWSQQPKMYRSLGILRERRVNGFSGTTPPIFWMQTSYMTNSLELKFWYPAAMNWNGLNWNVLSALVCPTRHRVAYTGTSWSENDLWLLRRIGWFVHRSILFVNYDDERCQLFSNPHRNYTTEWHSPHVTTRPALAQPVCHRGVAHHALHIPRPLVQDGHLHTQLHARDFTKLHAHFLVTQRLITRVKTWQIVLNRASYSQLMNTMINNNVTLVSKTHFLWVKWGGTCV